MPNFANESGRMPSPRKSCWLPAVYLLLFAAGIVQIQIVDGATLVAATTGNINTADNNNLFPPGTKSTATTTSTTTTSSAAGATTTFIDGRGRGGGDTVGFSALDKEVVDRLIKQWAPIVWLAPEEKFMPLGVEEFLNHVHPADKGKTLIDRMPFGDNSKKAYLVTNAEVEELLKNENSFIYGRNPNESPVPIYAVVSLCNYPKRTQTRAQPMSVYNEPSPLQELPFKQPTPAHMVQPPQSTRGPYIPVSIDPYDERNNTIRRSSRLYPVFKRVQRDVPVYSSPSVVNLPTMTFDTSSYGLVMGEANIGTAPPPPPQPVQTKTTPSSNTVPPPEAGPNVNNFIANLADNVKFTGVSDEIDNTISGDSGSAENIRIDDKKQIPSFHVTYWMFYPYSQGKTMCTLSLGPLGRIPFPAVYGFCLGKRKDIGSHIGDWEHMSLYFNGAAEPEAMYVSAHDAGAYYTYNHLTGSFEFKKQETRKGILQRPNFPKTVTTFNSHPVLFAAKGSHGLWTAPGKHRFVKVARLYDINGFGTPWNTWKNVDITYENLKSYGRSLIPNWLAFKGKWGNPKSKCHPLRRIGLNFCEYTDGPTGIPLKEPHFTCDASY